MCFVDQHIHGRCVSLWGKEIHIHGEGRRIPEKKIAFACGGSHVSVGDRRLVGAAVRILDAGERLLVITERICSRAERLQREVKSFGVRV